MKVKVKVNWHGEEYVKKVEAHIQQNLDGAAIAVQSTITSSFGNSGIKGQRSGATGAQRASNRSKPWGPPNVDTGHLKRNVGYDKPFGRPLARRIGTGIGNAQSVGYAMYLEFGTGPHVIKNAFGLGITVDHPGMLPRPFLRPGLHKAQSKIRKWLTRPLP